MQAALNPPGEQSVEKFGSAFSGDKVVQIETPTTAIEGKEDELVAEFDGRLVRYPCGELEELVLCHATTIHKSQGSEYPVVVILPSTQHCMMLKRSLIYGNTRGKRLVVVLGQKRALAMAVKSKRDERRLSKLRDRLMP